VVLITGRLPVVLITGKLPVVLVGKLCFVGSEYGNPENANKGGRYLQINTG